MSCGRRFGRRVTALIALAALLTCVFGLVVSAHATPVISEAKFSNPVAYELKSLLTTRFYFTADTGGAWATLTVSGAKGVVRTVFSGPVPTANQRVWTPVWNGTDAAGNRLATGSYDWKLVVTKGGSSAVKTGKIMVSKINFAVSGTLGEGVGQSFDRYMIDGPAFVYIRASTQGASTNYMSFTVNDVVRATSTVSNRIVPPLSMLNFPSGTTTNWYVWKDWKIGSRGTHRIGVVNLASSVITPKTMTYYATVIQ